jgi:hypothetical protein
MTERYRPRAGALRASCFNSGMEVWLYDEAHREQIRASGAFQALVEDGVGCFAAAAAPLVAQGLFVGVARTGDGSVDVSVMVGAPLSTDEIASTRWDSRPERAFLRLPSGQLCVESNDALRLGPGDAMEPGAVVAVPPGDYCLTLYRPVSGPSEVVVLTPGGTPAAGQPAILPLVDDAGGAAPWRMEDGRVHLQVRFDEFGVSARLALDRDGVASAGLVDGRVVDLQLAAGPRLAVAYLDPGGADRLGARPSRSRRIDWADAWFDTLDDGREWLVLVRRDPENGVDEELQRRWLDATFTPRS